MRWSSGNNSAPRHLTERTLPFRRKAISPKLLLSDQFTYFNSTGSAMTLRIMCRLQISLKKIWLFQNDVPRWNCKHCANVYHRSCTFGAILFQYKLSSDAFDTLHYEAHHVRRFIGTGACFCTFRFKQCCQMVSANAISTYIFTKATTPKVP